MKTSITIRRESRGALKWLPTVILFDNRLIRFYAGDLEQFEVKPGYLTININRTQRHSFEIHEGDHCEFIIRESIFDWTFIVKYLTYLALSVFWFYPASTRALWGEKSAAIYLGLITLIVTINGISKEYFYFKKEQAATKKMLIPG